MRSVMGVMTMPSTVNATDIAAVSTMDVCTASCTLRSSPAPKYCEITTPAPLASPLNAPMSRLMMGPTVPTAENASLLT